ncbi:MAG: PAS domain-containing protein, partial [Acidobacteria bacterium]|nr:PAS domain-containing protein [Acidobacteriota bacterium]
MSESPIRVCLNLIAAISGTQTVEEIYAAALDALAEGLQVSRASILLFDPDGVMRFKAWRGLSDEYRGAVEGHTPWTPDSPDPQPITVTDVAADPTLGEYHPIFRRERIAALAFIPLVSLGRVIGKFMLYYPAPHVFTDDELQLAALVASQVAFAVERTRAEEAARRSEERLRFALDAAEMGTWDWDLARNTVHWSDNLARIHGLPPESFDGTFASYEKEIHPDDRERVLSSIRHAIEAGAQHDVEYRLVAPDGTIRWAEGKGRVDRENDRPMRMSGICMIVTRRKEAELARLESAHEVARQKDEFLAVLSHELRTPLNAILGWLHILQHTPERLPEVLEIIGRNARQQAQLIEEILDVSRIITGKLELERSPVALQHVLQDAVRAAEPLAQARDIRLMADVPTP